MNGLLFGYESYVWVRRDVLQVVYEEGNLPPRWKPSRKRGRDSSWQWIKAKLVPATASASASNGATHGATNGSTTTTTTTTTTTSTNPQSSKGSPYGQVKLRRTAVRRSIAAPSSRNLTILVDDPEAGSFHQQSFTFETNAADEYVVTANSWWQPNTNTPNRTGTGTSSKLHHQQQHKHKQQHKQQQQPPQDLTELSHLHEAAVVYCLQKRYEQHQIYTYTGRVLLALNPFSKLSNLYGQQVIAQYQQQQQQQPFTATTTTNEKPPPHVYATAQDAYSSMMASRSNQSILVSGESGAGKTVTTKIILGYLTTLSKWKQSSTAAAAAASSSLGGGGGIESQVVHSNPILESFGNARTIRNDNSSRFGKFIDVRFDAAGRLKSASIDTYLLEKVRLISPGTGERNYHIFYELLAGLSQRDRKEFLLGNARPEDFRMTSASGTYDRRDGISDRTTFADLKMALGTIGFRPNETADLFRVCCALLQCSNLSFLESSSSGASEIDAANPSLRHAVKLLGVSSDALNKALCCSAIEARGEILYKTLSQAQAGKALEAFMKATYSALFLQIVSRINQSIAVTDDRTSAGEGGDLSIGVLDIFGFESFDTNSFEQLCINFCNEALQQQFNQFVFKEEQQEYQQEGIDWSFISFPDNQDILDLIEKRHEGILSILDEQNIVPGATDQSFSRTVYDKCAGHTRFSANSSQKILGIFCIEHYAGVVEYTTATFLEKNKDELPKETTLLLKSSSSPFIVGLGDVLHSKTRALSPKSGDRQLRRANSSLVRESVGSQFTGQLRELRKKIEQTTPHYIRCLKPNDLLVPGSFVSGIIADQLRCAGVLEAIRVSRVGFPQRYKHSEFLRRYQILATEQMPKHRRYYGDRDLCEVVVNFVVVLIRRKATVQRNDSQSVDDESTKGGIQMGRTKVFLRRFAFERLEYLRNEVLEDSAIVLQAWGRMLIARNRFLCICYNAEILQRLARRLYATRIAAIARRHRCATLIQKNWRAFYAERNLNASLFIAQWCQNEYRGMVAREICAFLMLDKTTKTIQRSWRRYRAKRQLRNVVRSIVKIQVLCRGYKAKGLMRELRREARDVQVIAKQRDLFKEEALRLRQELQTSRDNSVCSTESDPDEVRRLRSEITALKTELAKSGSPIVAQGAGINWTQNRRMQHASSSPGFPSPSESRFLPPRSPALSSSNSPSYWSSPLDLHRTKPTQLFPKSLLDEVEPAQLSPPTSPLCVSQSSNQESLYAELGERNVVGIPFREQVSAFHRGVSRGDLVRVTNILENSEFAQLLVNECNPSGTPALHLAIATGNRALVKKLLDNGAAGNCQDLEGNTSLHVCTDHEFVLLLLESGHANPNMPNNNGLSALHMAVGRLDVSSVQHMLRRNADVNVADNTGWLTPLHLVARKADPADGINQHERNPRARIASLLCRVTSPDIADLNFQDKNGNTPLHHVVVLEIAEACDLLRTFLENGGKPNIANERGQTPLHLLCHNDGLRNVGVMQEMLYDMLYHGANPNIPSQTGCTALHLTLYHRDIDSAVQVMNRGAELHLLWNKPKRWTGFWDDMGTSEVLALDMISDENALHRVLAAISKPQKWAPNRPWCMHCKTMLGSFARALHCRHCGRLVCGACSQQSLSPEFFPKSFEIYESSWICIVCEKILVSRKDDDSTQPNTSVFGDANSSTSRGSF